ncbi:NAD(P)-dependent dehydrogenase, short-chain alcohol dehydrogenase family [Filimonas lacunae]|uniref:NAD(P)-dependent dehydrogenase, short-chain alcohol dehydrogenase family n=1 Tax=Filimonas lacunae TaxID=477680 RepID=A0A173MIT1_9BACT|nr:SDR family oxidoreductase [Filimonas lacunae]BAV07400.1 short chain dehydrogenase [Filimonas lacunae]SIT30502.1 NAD(P)-dependent dehydrogenase, short-chain alcohol dehydrogenase family [Filimonas lacunae]
MKATNRQAKVIIAGGTSGIGLATAILLAEKGALVTVTGRDEAKCKVAAAAHANIQAVVLDSSKRDELDTFFQQQGRVDHLVIALSGAKGAGPFAKLNLSEFRDAFEGKFWPHLNTLQAALPSIKEDGSITLITATSATAKMPGTSGLAALNGGLELMIPILAKELKPVRVNAVSPGVTDTNWWSFLPEEAKQEAFAQYATQIPVGRVGKPEEVAEAITCLIDNTYITGTVLHCDGGLGL